MYHHPIIPYRSCFFSLCFCKHYSTPRLTTSGLSQQYIFLTFLLRHCQFCYLTCFHTHYLTYFLGKIMRMMLFLLYYNFCMGECRWIPEVYSNVNPSLFITYPPLQIFSQIPSMSLQIPEYTQYTGSHQRNAPQKSCVCPKEQTQLFAFILYLF